MIIKNTPIVYDESGKGETVILLHGLGHNRTVWTKIPEIISNDYHMINVDMRGFGDSRTDDLTSIDFDNWKQDLQCIIRKVSTNRVHLIGHSLGSFIALAAAADMPDHIASVTAISCFKQFSPNVSRVFTERANLIMNEGITQQFINSTLTGFSERSLTELPEAVQKYKQVLAGNDRMNYAQALRVINRLSIESELPKINCPVLIISGKDDLVIPPHESKEVQESIKGAEWRLLKKAGHQVHLEQTEQLTEEIIQFLRRNAKMSKAEERDPNKRVARFKELRPNWKAWEDCDIPGNFRGVIRYMGAVASTSSQGKAPIDGENFSIGVVLVPPGNGPQLHDHTTEEVFIPLSGEWEVYWGENGEERMRLDAWDCVSMPTNLMRAFVNVGKEYAYMLAIIAGDAPPVNWKNEELNGKAVE